MHFLHCSYHHGAESALPLDYYKKKEFLQSNICCFLLFNQNVLFLTSQIMVPFKYLYTK